MAKKDIDPKELEKKTRETAEVVEDALRNIASQVGSIFQQALEGTSTFAKTLKTDITRSINDLAKTSTILLSNNEKLKSGELTKLQVTKQIEQRKLKILSIEQSISIAIKNGTISQTAANKQLKQATEYEKEFIENLEEQGELADKYNKKLGVTGGVLKGLNKIPILGSLINAEKVLGKIQAETAKEGSTKFSVFKEGMKGVGSSIKENLTDPTVLMTGGFSIVTSIVKFFVDAMFGASQRVTDIAKNLSISKGAAEGMYVSLINSKGTLDTIYGTTANLTEAFNDISQLTEFATVATLDQVEAQIILTKQLGQSKEEALGLQETFAVNNIESGKGVDIVYEQIAAFANQNKMTADGRKILQDISKTSKIIQLNFKGNIGELVKTTLEAKKLGLSLDQVNKIGGSLLNFEQSISAELEAELITGRDLNLEKAREYALNNDIAGLTHEIANQGITAEKFSKMNRIEQEAIAKVLGMQASELADSLYKQNLIEKTGGKELENMKSRLKVLHDAGKSAEEYQLSQHIALLEAGVLTGKNLVEAQKSASAQESFNVAIEHIKEVFSDMVTGGLLDKLIGFLTQFVKALESGQSLASMFFTGVREKSDTSLSEAGKSFQQSDEIKGTDEKSLKDKKSLLKKAHFGNITSQIQRSQEEESRQEDKGWLTQEFSHDERSKARKAQIEKLQKWMVDNKDVEIEMRDGKSYSKPTPIKLPPGNIVTPPNPNSHVDKSKTDLSSQNAKLSAQMDELIAATKKGGNVYLDSNKVGTALLVGAHKPQ